MEPQHVPWRLSCWSPSCILSSLEDLFRGSMEKFILNGTLEKVDTSRKILTVIWTGVNI